MTAGVARVDSVAWEQLPAFRWLKVGRAAGHGASPFPRAVRAAVRTILGGFIASAAEAFGTARAAALRRRGPRQNGLRSASCAGRTSAAAAARGIATEGRPGATTKAEEVATMPRKTAQRDGDIRLLGLDVPARSS